MPISDSFVVVASCDRDELFNFPVVLFWYYGKLPTCKTINPQRCGLIMFHTSYR
jgi:hypothetical protein